MVKKRVKRIIYTICFMMLCVTDWVVGSQDGRLQFIATNLTGVSVGILILGTYKFKDFLKPVYFVWSGIILLGAPAAIIWAHGNYPYQGKFITAVINVCILGFIVLRTLEDRIARKKTKNVRWPFLIVWFATMVYMMFSPDLRVWPIWFAFMFGTFYLTDFAKEDMEIIWQSMTDGIIVGFLLMQGCAFLVRPYDVARYRGAYINENINSLFYLMVYCALLCKQAFLWHYNKSLICRVITIIAAGFMIGFVAITGCRTSLFAMVLVTVFYNICILRGIIGKEGHKDGYKDRFGVLKQLGIIVLVGIISVPIIYLPVRYMPTILHRPFFWIGEYNENKVHSFDPWNSTRYVSFEEMLQEDFGRILFFVPSLQEPAELQEEDDYEVLENVDYMMLSTEKLSTIKQREYIYAYYLKNLKLKGHPASEDGVYISPRYYKIHAHDFLLQISFWFGIPVGIAFLFFFVLVFVYTFLLMKKKKTVYACVLGCFGTAFVSFGLFEYIWGLGQMPLTLFFLILYFVMNKGAFEEESVI